MVYVNHPRRMYSYYQDLKNELKQKKQTVSHIHVLGNEWGLACNGLHFIDLASFLMDKNPISVSNNHLEDIRPSKRLGYIEFTGHLWVHFEQRSTLLLSSLIGNNRSTSIEIICQDHKYHIEEGGRGIITLFKNSKWISDTPINTPFQSELTTYLIEDILNGKTPKITPLQLSKTCHQSFIESLKNFYIQTFRRGLQTATHYIMKELVLIGSGNMAIAYCEALKFLNIDFTVIGNSKEKAKEFTTKTGKTCIPGGIQKYLENNSTKPSLCHISRTS